MVMCHNSKQRIMINRFLSVVILLLTVTLSSAQSGKHSIGHIGLVYPLSTNGLKAGSISNSFSLHAIAGLSSSEEAFCASGVTNLIMQNANGAIMAGFSNHVLGSAQGAMLAGFMNTVNHDAGGLLAAGFANISGSMNGAQLAGFVNVSAGNVDGVQAAGFINVAGDVNTQVAGFVNVARNVSGVQLAGFINVAEHSDYPIGIVNIIKDGDQGLGLTFDETQTTLVSLRSGGRKLYGILGVGINLREYDPLYALECGIGAHVIHAGVFRLNLEASVLSLTDFYDNTYLRSSLRLLPSVRLADKIELFGGPSFNHIIFEDYARGDIITNYVWENNSWGYTNGLYIGGIAGLQIML